MNETISAKPMECGQNKVPNGKLIGECKSKDKPKLFEFAGLSFADGFRICTLGKAWCDDESQAQSLSHHLKETLPYLELVWFYDMDKMGFLNGQ